MIEKQYGFHQNSCILQDLIQSVFDGYNVCICAYGQTGSGKTYTILGDESNPGLAPRTFNKVFQLAKDYRARFDISVSTYILELYNDKLLDLLRPEHSVEVSFFKS